MLSTYTADYDASDLIGKRVKSKNLPGVAPDAEGTVTAAEVDEYGLVTLSVTMDDGQEGTIEVWAHRILKPGYC